MSIKEKVENDTLSIHLVISFCVECKRKQYMHSVVKETLMI